MKYKAFIGVVGGIGYAIKITGVDPGFLQAPFGRQAEVWPQVRAWQAEAKTDWIYTKARDGRNPATELRRWLKVVKPTEFFARWPTDVNDDSMQVFYRLY